MLEGLFCFPMYIYIYFSSQSPCCSSVWRSGWPPWFADTPARCRMAAAPGTWGCGERGLSWCCWGSCCGQLGPTAAGRWEKGDGVASKAVRSRLGHCEVLAGFSFPSPLAWRASTPFFSSFPFTFPSSALPLPVCPLFLRTAQGCRALQPQSWVCGRWEENPENLPRCSSIPEAPSWVLLLLSHLSDN